jgi:hypothetical protein
MSSSTALNAPQDTMQEPAHYPAQPGDEHLAEAALFPEFRLVSFNHQPGDADIEIGLLKNPSVKRHASMALLYGLAILTLDQTKVIAATIDKLLADGPINEVDACNRISLLIQQDANELLV